MAKTVVTTPTLLENLAAETKLAANKQTAVVRGWQAITPEVLEAAAASDVKRTAELTQHYMARFS